MIMIDSRFYVNVKKLMTEQGLPAPKCRLPKPKMKPNIFITGWGEWLPCIVV